jgi:hypothetical protein
LAAKSGKPLPVAAKNSKPVGILRRMTKELTGGDEPRKKQNVLSKLFQGSKG